MLTELPIWQSVWQGIRFKELPPFTSSSEFYRNFYSHFYKIYDSFEDIEINWRDEKAGVAEELARIIEKNVDCLSIGSGTGFIEKILAHNRKDLTIYLSREDADFSKWVNSKNVKHVTEKEKKIVRKIFMVQVLYALSDKYIQDLIKELRKDFPEFDEIIFVDRFLENQSNSSLLLLVDFCKHVVFESLKKFTGERVIFWGYVRSLSFFRRLIERNGKCELIELYLVGDEYLIRYKVRS